MYYNKIEQELLKIQQTEPVLKARNWENDERIVERINKNVILNRLYNVFVGMNHRQPFDDEIQMMRVVAALKFKNEHVDNIKHYFGFSDEEKEVVNRLRQRLLQAEILMDIDHLELMVDQLDACEQSFTKRMIESSLYWDKGYDYNIRPGYILTEATFKVLRDIDKASTQVSRC